MLGAFLALLFTLDARDLRCGELEALVAALVAAAHGAGLFEDDALAWGGHFGGWSGSRKTFEDEEACLAAEGGRLLWRGHACVVVYECVVDYSLDVLRSWGGMRKEAATGICCAEIGFLSPLVYSESTNCLVYCCLLCFYSLLSCSVHSNLSSIDSD